MKYHLSILLGIIKQALIYTLVPAFFYLLYYSGTLLLNLPDISEQQSALMIDALTLFGVIYYFKLYKKETFYKLFPGKLEGKKLLSLIPLSILSRIPLVIFVVAIVLFFGESVINTIDEGVEYQWQGFSDLSGWGYVVAILSFSILGPIHEELFFRGIVFNYLKKYYSVKGSILYATVIFTLFHFHPGLFPSSFILGLFLIWVYQKWHNLTYSILLHMLINLHPFLIDWIGTKF